MTNIIVIKWTVFIERVGKRLLDQSIKVSVTCKIDYIILALYGIIHYVFRTRQTWCNDISIHIELKYHYKITTSLKIFLTVLLSAKFDTRHGL